MAEKKAMGIGKLGFNNLVFKRKFRFTFELQDICSGGGKNHTVGASYIKSAARPSLEVEETEINYLNGKNWIPGRGTWQPITVTYLDVANMDDENQYYLYDWLASTYDFTDRINLHQGSRASDYSATGIIKLWDGCGGLLETWTLLNVWPTSINFGELDYSNNEEATIELTLRYSDVVFEHNCPSRPIFPCCTPCGE